MKRGTEKEREKTLVETLTCVKSHTIMIIINDEVGSVCVCVCPSFSYSLCLAVVLGDLLLKIFSVKADSEAFLFFFFN